MESSGIPLFNSKAEDLDMLDATLFGGFFHSLQTYIETKVKDKKISVVSLGGSKIIFHYGKREILFISKCKKKCNHDKVLKKLQIIEERFFHSYGDILDGWSGQTDVFEKFKDEIRDII